MTKNLNIQHLSENDVVDTLWNKNILEKYNYGQMYLPIKKEEIQNFLDEIIQNYPGEKYEFVYGSSKTYIIETQNYYVQIDERPSNSDLYFFTIDRGLSMKIWNIYQKYKSSDLDNFISFIDISYTQGKIIEKEKEMFADDFKHITKEFYPFLNVDDLIEMFLKGKENLLILGGKPGTGKSKFISYLLKWVLFTKFKENFVVGNAKDINLLNMDLFWQKSANYDLLILDDLDFMLGNRNESREDIQKNNFLSKLLSFTDGVIENNTKIIITTNQPINEIDDALLREGRIFDILNFRYLKKSEAEKILKKYNIKNVDLEDVIPQSKIGSIIENVRELGSFKRKYLKEDISLLHKKVDKSIGFL